MKPDFSRPTLLTLESNTKLNMNNRRSSQILLKLFSVKFLFLLSILMASTSYAQSRLGYSKLEILEEFREYNPEFEIKENGTNSIHFKMDRAVVFQYLNEKEICDMSVIAPRSDNDLNFFVEMYNELYVNIDDRNWKMYSENGTISSIELVHHNDLTFFVWK
jgi:hypothetical protein